MIDNNMKKAILIILLSISFSFTQSKETNEKAPKFEQFLFHPEAKKIVDVSSLFYRGNLLHISYPEPYTGMVVELGTGKADYKIFDQSGFVKSRSKLEVLYHYLKIIVPAIVTVLSVTWLIECFNTILHHQEKTEFIFLWILFSISNPLNWCTAISLAVLGIYLLATYLNKRKIDAI